MQDNEVKAYGSRDWAPISSSLLGLPLLQGTRISEMAFGSLRSGPPELDLCNI